MNNKKNKSVTPRDYLLSDAPYDHNLMKEVVRYEESTNDQWPGIELKIEDLLDKLRVADFNMQMKSEYESTDNYYLLQISICRRIIMYFTIYQREVEINEILKRWTD